MSEHPNLAQAGQRALGAYYTAERICELMVQWAVQPADRVLEPSMGDGAFVRAALEAGASQVTGVELAADTYASTSAQLGERVQTVHADFLRVAPFEVDAVVGNPPFVRLRALDAAGRSSALEAASEVLGEPMGRDGSLWMPFVLHASRFVAPGGRMALVIPFDASYVTYAQALWRYLCATYASVEIVRVRERMFDILQECLLLRVAGRGGSCEAVRYLAYETIDDLQERRPCVDKQLSAAALYSGVRSQPLVGLHMPDGLGELLDELHASGAIHALRHEADVRIGYVSGDKDFFHPDPQIVRSHAIPEHALVPTLADGRQLAGAGIDTLGIERMQQLLVAGPDDAHQLASYIHAGEQRGVHRRYKCRVREPWYQVPGVRVPDYVLGVFGDWPILLANGAHAAASNSLLCIYAHEVAARDLHVRWYSPLTLLQAELNVHALGGGVFVFVPREVAAMSVPTMAVTDEGRTIVDSLLREGDRQGAFTAGAEYVLGKALGLSIEQRSLIEQGAAELRRWRVRPR
jgi:predicted RNA methylase